MADHVAKMGEDAEAKGPQAHRPADYYMRAGYYYYTGERMVPPGELKSSIYAKALKYFNKGLPDPLSRISSGSTCLMKTPRCPLISVKADRRQRSGADRRGLRRPG